MRSLYAIYLGIILDVIGFPFYTWQFWVVALPTIILEVIFNNSKR
jgi:hypothetical protein